MSPGTISPRATHVALPGSRAFILFPLRPHLGPVARDWALVTLPEGVDLQVVRPSQVRANRILAPPVPPLDTSVRLLQIRVLHPSGRMSPALLQREARLARQLLNAPCAPSPPPPRSRRGSSAGAGVQGLEVLLHKGALLGRLTHGPPPRPQSGTGVVHAHVHGVDLHVGRQLGPTRRPTSTSGSLHP